MKYLLQPLPNPNPYQNQQKQPSINPYSIVQNKNEDIQKHDVLEQPALKIFCQSCKKEITHHSFIKSNCKQQCITCFSHLQTFPQIYTVQQKLDFPIFQSSWSAYQQVLLLKSIEKWGFGNWKQIHDYMQYFGVKFTQDEIESHYNTFYIHQKSFQLRFSQSLIERKKEYQQSCKSQSDNKQNPVSILSLTTHLPEDDNNYPFEEIDDFSHQPIIQALPNHLLSPPTQPIPGYNSQRKQFDVNFDQHAQKTLANLEFRDDDLPQQKQVKFKMIEEYNQRLNKRYQVQDFIIEHKLLDQQFQKQQEESRSVYEKQAALQLKRFMRFSSFQQHNELIRRLAMQKQLKSIIEGLRSFRKPSNSGKLKQILQGLRKRQISPSKSKSRGKPRKIIHVDNKFQSSTENQNQLMKRLRINMKDLKHIVNQSTSKNNGETFVYRGVEVTVVDRK